MKVSSLALIFVVVILCGCTPARISKQIISSAAEKASVVVYREHAYMYSAVDIVFGSNALVLAKIRDSARIELELNPGDQKFFIRTTQADKPFILNERLSPNEKICLIARSKPENYAKALFIISAWTTSSFTLEKVDCGLPEFKSRT